MAQDLHSVVEDILATYEARIKKLGDKLKEKGIQLLEHSKNERANLTQNLESILAKKAYLRRKDFRLMMQDIESYQMEREKSVRQLIEGISKEERKRIQILKKSLDTNQDAEAVSEVIKITTIPGKEKLIEEELAKFEREKEKLSSQLKGLSEKADSLSVKDFKKRVKRLKAQKSEASSEEQAKSILFEQQELQKEARELLANFKSFQRSIEDIWQNEISKIEGGE